MGKIFNKILSYLKQSCLKDGVMSSTRISSYLIMILIYLIVFYFIGVGIYSMINNIPVIISGEYIIIFGSLLSHHLILLGINKQAETKIREIKAKLKD